MLEKQLQKKVKTQHVSQGFLIDFTYCLQKNKEQDLWKMTQNIENKRKIKNKRNCACLRVCEM